MMAVVVSTCTQSEPLYQLRNDSPTYRYTLCLGAMLRLSHAERQMEDDNGRIKEIIGRSSLNAVQIR